MVSGWTPLRCASHISMTTNGQRFSLPSPKPAYSISEVAQLLGIHRATVSRFIKSGELRVSRLGHRTVRITHEALMDFLRAHEEERQ
jgi:excisionase family DNA binding protein